MTLSVGRLGVRRELNLVAKHWNEKPTQGIPLSRRDFAALVGGAGAAMATGFPVRTMAQTPTVPIPTDLKEAPVLAEQSASGAIPPVAERLPVNPLVVTPNQEIGTYGGTWRTAIVGGLDLAWLVRTVGYDYLVRWDPKWEAVVPNVAESWEVSADGRTYTFTLREGHKWSDGQPFTVDDVMFFGQDVYGNEELTTSAGTNPWTIEKVDELRFAVTFERPDGLFIQNLATPQDIASNWTRYPRHYLEQFHATYNTTNLDQLVAEAGTETWARLFQQMSSAIPGTPVDARFQNLELPTLFGWRLTEPYADGTRVRVERNPFYFKVDPDGNQLPYIDEVIFNAVQDNEVLLLQATNGELDMHARHITSDVNKSVLSQSAEEGGYRLFEMLPASMNTCMIALNQTSQDPALQPIFANKDFRVGLSHAINRQEIIDAVFVSQGEPWQGSPRPESAYANETLAKQFTEFDADLANQHLDRVLPNKDGSGMRLRPDGQPLVFTVDVTSLESTWVDQMNLVIGYWQAVGVNAQLKPQDRSLLYQRKDANEHQCVVWGGDGGFNDALLEMRWYAPVSGESNFGIGWFQWFAKP
nr:ABC transporter substrate-binding protein [Chloroflexia bacterium]